MFSCYLKTELHASRQLTRPCLGKPSFMLLIIRGRHLKGESILPNWALKVTKAGKQHEKNRAFCWVWVGSERTGEKDEQEGPGLEPILPRPHPRRLSKEGFSGEVPRESPPQPWPRGSHLLTTPSVGGTLAHLPSECPPLLSRAGLGPAWALGLPMDQQASRGLFGPH